MANPFHGSGPLRSREGLTSRPAAASDDIQLQIDPIHADLDDHITGLRGKIRQLKGVAQEIENEAKFQKDFISQLQMTLIKAQAGSIYGLNFPKDEGKRYQRRIRSLSEWITF
ncbi:hypothetical protein OPV22_023784 [Ensete ventricosum]|uniref:Bet1-like protein n=1 Tax=Ensete ventricosum TaxID=4639 RepID=A0AAV8QML3_ENSVE|nr:hypothetical protein OPV22_023784 [Ensete ventricosum]